MPTFFEPILVAFDGSTPSRAASRFARLLAEEHETRTILLHAREQPDDGDGEAGRMLEEEAQRFGTPVDTRIVVGPACEAVAAQADALGVGLVAVGTRGTSTPGDSVIGSVARAVLDRVRRPTLVAHAAFPAVRQIVVGVAEGHRAQAIVLAGRAAADATGARLVLAHVLTAPPDLAHEPQDYGFPGEAWSDALEAVADRVFGPHRAVAGTGAHERVLFGSTPEQLRALALGMGAELVVVGRSARAPHGVESLLGAAATLAMRGPFATLIV